MVYISEQDIILFHTILALDPQLIFIQTLIPKLKWILSSMGRKSMVACTSIENFFYWTLYENWNTLQKQQRLLVNKIGIQMVLFSIFLMFFFQIPLVTSFQPQSLQHWRCFHGLIWQFLLNIFSRWNSANSSVAEFSSCEIIIEISEQC